MKKATWVVHAIAECENCGFIADNYKNAQAVGAKHAKNYKHKVRVKVGLCSLYDGTVETDESLS